MTSSLRQLRATQVVFYSQGDEASFFSRLHDIAPIREIFGEGDSIIIECDVSLMSNDVLRELIAIFYRYKVDTEQLDIFLTEENRHWFQAKNAYWRNDS